MRETLWPVVEEHLDEAEYLVRRWEDGLNSPLLALRRAAHGEERLLSHLDGLAEACPEALPRLLEPALDGQDVHRALAAAHAILRTGVPGIERLVERLLGSPTAEPCFRALCLGPREVAPALGPLLSSSTALHRAWALGIQAFRQTPAGGWLEPFLADETPVVAAAALRVARFSGSDASKWVQRGLASTDLGLRDAAIEAGLLGGQRDAWVLAQQAVDRRSLRSDLPFFAIAMSADPKDVERLAGVLDDELERAAAIYALGFSGLPQAVDLCLPFLRDSAVSRLAGEAIAAVTGLKLEGTFCQPARDESDGDAPGPDDDPEEMWLVELPVPDPDAVEQWWGANRARFESGRRYIGGRPWSPEVLVDALVRGPMRRRHVLALEASIRTSGRFRLETRGWVRNQQRALSSAPGSLMSMSPAPFGEWLR